jgi:hypothetical protein
MVDCINIVPSINTLFDQCLKYVFKLIYISCSCTCLEKRLALYLILLLYVVYMLVAITLSNVREHLIHYSKKPFFFIRHKDNFKRISIVCLLKLLKELHLLRF